ncbi:MAG: phage portal protein [Clostridia bacterium]
MIRTYQDFEKVMNNENKKKIFISEAIQEHKASTNYKIAESAYDYDRQQNTDIMKYEKCIRNMQGGKIIDIFAPNNKIASNFFNQFTNQENQYLLSNGIDFEDKDEKIKNILGEKFDIQLQKGAKNALIAGASYGFWNNDKIIFFEYTEFVPFLDEISGELRAGIRFWQLEKEKPIMITLYEEDGYTEYIQKGDALENTTDKNAYITIVRKSNVKIEEIENRNYTKLPIIPLYTNKYHDSRLLGMKNTIDLYDRIFSEFGNDFDRYQQIYWVFKNCGGMNEQDIGKFMTKLKVFGGADVDSENGNANAEANTIDIPYAARQVALEMLEKRIYKDYGAIDISNISSNATQDEINSKYMPLDLKVDEFEYYIREFLEKLFNLLGRENIKFKFNRDKMESKQNEIDLELKKAQAKQIETTTILSIADLLDAETLIKILIDKEIIDVDDIKKVEKDNEKINFAKKLIERLQNEADNRIEALNNFVK